MDNYTDIQCFQYHKATKSTTVFFSGGKTKEIKKTARALMNEICLQNGTTLQGQEYAARKNMKWTQKIPIYTGGIGQRMFFTDTSYHENRECFWFAEDHILSVIQTDEFEVTILFTDGSRRNYVGSRRMFERQMERCDEYRAFLMSKSECV